VSAGELKPETSATWLSNPTAHEVYAVMLFYHDESKWRMAAQYNRRRLLGVASPDPSPQPIRAASPG
jgi:hypothetical protein